MSDYEIFLIEQFNLADLTRIEIDPHLYTYYDEELLQTVRKTDLTFWPVGISTTMRHKIKGYFTSI